MMTPDPAGAPVVPDVAVNHLVGDVIDALRALTGVAPVLVPGAGSSVAAASATGLTSLGVATGSLTNGGLFVAVAGARSHGARYVPEAVAAGARAVLTDTAGAAIAQELVTPTGAIADGGVSASRSVASVPLLVLDVPDLRSLLGALSAWWYGTPVAAMTSYAVTGTNGKTTTSYLLDALAQAAGYRTGLVGTVEIRSAGRVVPSVLTTPEAPDLQQHFAQMRQDGVSSLAMEVSSHALALHRVDGIVFDVAGFTNLTQDHLDFHGDLESYFAAKALLFTPDHARRAVVCVDDEWGTRLAARSTIPVTTLATRPRPVDSGADGMSGTDWRVQDVVMTGTATSFDLVHRDGDRLPVTTVLPGSFNIANTALALVMMMVSGVGVGRLAEVLAGHSPLNPQVPGRMELVGTSPRTVVDFAHNPDALERAIEALRPTTAGRLHVVFGATGDRDRTKRPVMGEIAARLADVVVVTDDDPHTEPPAPIRAAVLQGAERVPPARRAEIYESSPRAQAIREAVSRAADDDTVLVAGRGHERWQDVDGVAHPLDDRVEARAALASRGSVADAAFIHDPGEGTR